MSSLLAVSGIILAVEVFFQFRNQYNRCRLELVATINESAKTIRSKTILDRAKEKLLLGHSFKLFISALTLLGFILLTVFPLGVIIIVSNLIGGHVLDFLLSPTGSFLSILFSTLYVVARKLIRDD